METLYGLKINGGGGLVNIKQKDKALKAQWVIKAMQKENIGNLAKTLLNTKMEDFIWEAQLNSKHIHKIFGQNFWADALRAWCEITRIQPDNQSQVLAQPLWGNSNICINGKPVFDPKICEAGMKYTSDIVNPDGQFKTSQQIQNDFKIKIPFTKIYGLQKAITEEWKFLLVGNEEKIEIQKMYQYFAKQTKSNVKTFYEKLVNNPTLCKEYVYRWERNKLDLSEQEFITNICNINKLTINVKLRSFQYRLLTHGIIMNIQLKNYGIKEHNLCTFCTEHKESIIHLFCECKETKILWDFVKQKCEIAMLDPKKIIMNRITTPVNSVENMIVLITKHYIYRTKCKNEKPSKRALEQYIKEIEIIEETIARSKNKSATHEKKWYKYK